MRIVSLLPSTTEILYAVGAGPDVVGVTFECDYPAEARREAAVVSFATMPSGLTPAGIDAWVTSARSRGADLYRLDEDALAGLDADLVVTQDLCAVCAVDVSVVQEALDHLGCRAEVLTIDPHTLAEVIGSVRTIGAATGREQAADALADRLENRLENRLERHRSDAASVASVASATRPRVVVLEWVDPPFAPGHWIPEMVTAAGGDCVLGRAGAPSRRVTWDDVRAARADLVVVAPCGYDREAAQRQADELVESGALPPDVPVLAVDANASWARPGPRLLDGIDELAAAVDDLGERPTLLPRPRSER